MISLAIISGLSAIWIAAGVGAAALPLVAHLLSRRGGPTIEFPAVRFVRMAAAEQAARDRPRDLLLLLLRMLIIALIALAFDRPVWSSSGEKAGGGGEDVVVVLDASASMTRLERGRSLFEMARDRAIEELNGAGAATAGGAGVGVVIARLSPEAVLPRLAEVPDPLISALRGVACTLERADMQSALSLAASLPGPGDDVARARRIVIFSDMQATQWSGVVVPAGVTLDLRVVGEEASVRNLAVSGAEVSPPRPIAGREAIVSAKVENYSDAAVRPTVVCEWGAGGSASVSPNIAATGAGTVSFPVVFEGEGEARVRLGVTDGSFTSDDSAYLVIDVRRARRLAMITEAPETDRAGGAYFMEAGLAPAARGEYEVVRMTPAEATPEMLSSFDGAVIVQGGALPDGTLKALSGFVTSGGGVLWVVDSQGAHESAGGFDSAGGVSLPTMVRGAFTRLAGSGVGSAMTLRTGEFDTGPLRALEGPAGRSLLEATFGSYSPAELSPGAVMLIQFANGDPLAAWQLAGSGRVVMIHADLSPAHSSLAKGPMFPVVLHELMRFVMPASGGRAAAEVGEVVSARVAAGTPLQEPVTDGGGRPVRIMRGGASFEPVLTGGPGDHPGFAEFKDAAGRVAASAAVVLSPDESDLRPLDAEAMAAIARDGGEAFRIASAAPGMGVTRRVIELWPWIFASAVVMLACESLIVGWTRRSRPAGVFA